MLDVENQIKKWLEGTNLSEEAKKTLQNESVTRYNGLIKELGIPPEELAKDVLHVTCDEYSCAVIRKIPRADIKYLAEVRRKTGIRPAEPIEKVDAMVKLLKRDVALIKDAKEILSHYKDTDTKAYFKGSPSVTAATAIRIASLMRYSDHKPVPVKEIIDNFNITQVAISSRYHEIAESLNLYGLIPKDQRESKRHSKW